MQWMMNNIVLPYSQIFALHIFDLTKYGNCKDYEDNGQCKLTNNQTLTYTGQSSPLDCPIFLSVLAGENADK